MPLTISLERYPEGISEWETQKTLTAGRLSIGRSSHYDWVLQDPEKHLSRLQCVIEFTDGNYYITDESTNGVFLNGSEERLQRGVPSLIQNGNHLAMGDYEMGIRIDDEVSPIGPQAETLIGTLPTDILGEDPNVGMSAAPTADPGVPAADFDILDGMGGMATPNSGDDPLLPPAAQQVDALGLEVVAGGYPQEKATESDHLPPEEAFFHPPDPVAPEPTPPPEPPQAPVDNLIPDASAGGGGIPDNWWEADPLMATGGTSAPAAPLTPPAPPIPPTPSPIPSPDLLESAPPSPTSQEEAAAQAPTMMVAAGDLDPIRPSTMPASSQAYAPLPGTHAVPSLATTEKPPTPPSPISASPPPVATGTDPALQAFLEGAGMPDLEIAPEKVAEAMLSMGKTFRQTVSGMMAVLVARSGVKSELQVERTMIQPMGNNPLKAPAGCPPLSVEETMKLMLTRNIMGFMPAEQAVKEGFNDVQVHEMAVMAGLQAALKGILDHFKPEQLEGRLSSHSVLDSILPGNRKAKYWDTFCQFYAKLAQEAEDDFNEMFRDCFATAYEEEIRKIKSM